MTTPESLLTRFSDPAAFRKLFGFLLGGRAKRAHAIFAAAENKAARRTYGLDRREHEGTVYVIKAIGVQGDLSRSTLDALTRAAEMVPLGTVRYEGSNAAFLPVPFGSYENAIDITSLSRPEEGIFVFAVTLFGKKRDVSWALWANLDGVDYVLPLDDRKI